jgi:hypothetical protein
MGEVLQRYLHELADYSFQLRVFQGLWNPRERVCISMTLVSKDNQPYKVGVASPHLGRLKSDALSVPGG